MFGQIYLNYLHILTILLLLENFYIGIKTYFCLLETIKRQIRSKRATGFIGKKERLRYRTFVKQNYFSFQMLNSK